MWYKCIAWFHDMTQNNGKRGERWYHSITIIMLNILKDPMEGLNHISP